MPSYLTIKNTEYLISKGTDLIMLKVSDIDLSKVPTAILQGVQKHWGERAVTNGAHTIY